MKIIKDSTYWVFSFVSMTNVDKYFGPLHYSRLDHVAYTIMKGRDYGLPDYNTVREQIGFRRMKSFEDINPRLARDNPSVQKKIKCLNEINRSINKSINQPINYLCNELTTKLFKCFSLLIMLAEIVANYMPFIFQLFNKTRQLYGDIDKLDVFVGGMLETSDGPGELFTAILQNQFHNIRHGDWFWFENTKSKWDLVRDRCLSKEFNNDNAHFWI